MKKIDKFLLSGHLVAATIILLSLIPASGNAQVSQQPVESGRYASLGPAEGYSSGAFYVLDTATGEVILSVRSKK